MILTHLLAQWQEVSQRKKSEEKLCEFAALKPQRTLVKQIGPHGTTSSTPTARLSGQEKRPEQPHNIGPPDLQSSTSSEPEDPVSLSKSKGEVEVGRT